MRLLHSAPNVAHVNHLKSVLESMGIRCRVRGEYLSAAVGELPPIECWAELWIVDDERHDDALDVLRHASASRRGEWTCPECGESVDAGFEECWNCRFVRGAIERAG